MKLMQFGSSVSTSDSTDEALDDVIRTVIDAGAEPDVVFAFFTGHHVPEHQRLVERLWLELDPQVMLACSAEGVIGGDQEVERAPGLSILFGTLPDVRIHPFHIPMQDWRRLLLSPEDLLERMGCGEETRALIGFGDPFTTPTSQFLPTLDEVAPQAPLIGGMASTARQPGHNVLIRNDQAYDEGFVGVSLSGPIDVQTIVSQGCRPIGQPYIVTKAHENVIEQLGGKPALHIVRDTINSLSEQDQQLLSSGLLLGRAISEYRDTFARGDFLVRNLMGADKESGSIAVADYVRVGQTVQFHVRDARTADEDLASLLQVQDAAAPPAAGLLFSCNGRGTNLFDQPCHDIAAARSAMRSTPFTGFFAAGELGPVGGKNFIHGHTASLALLRPKKA
ncbi:MAG TPA: FIST N-terminal domain-containing protein [Tepidisphaeraceae bacterium]|jgi:small ligand-binding sensory domain FIST